MRKIILPIFIPVFLTGMLNYSVFADDIKFNPVYVQDFSGAVGTEWTKDNEINIADGCLFAGQLSSNKNAVLTLSEPISSGQVKYEMKFKYANSKGIDLIINSGSGQGTYLSVGQDNSGNDRVLITNAAQNGFIQVIKSNGGEPGDGEYHTLELLIDLDNKDLSVSYDGDKKTDTKYAQSSVARFNFTFNGGKAGTFYIDELGVFSSAEEEEPIGEICIEGKPCIGHALTVPDAPGEVTWYVSDTEDGEYRAVYTGPSYVIDGISVGKWIKAGIKNTYSEPVEDQTPRDDIYIQDFDGELSKEWVCDENVTAENGNLICRSNTKGNAELTLPSSISAGKLVCDIKFKYQNSKGVTCTLNNGGDQGTLMVMGQSNDGNDRCWITNSKQDNYFEIVQEKGGGPGDGSYHTIRLVIDLKTKNINAIYDDAEKVITKYSQDSVLKLKLAFQEGKPGVFYVDCLRFFTIIDETEDQPYLSLNKKSIYMNDIELSDTAVIYEAGTVYGKASLNNFSGEAAEVDLVIAVYKDGVLNNISISAAEIMNGMENYEIVSENTEITAGSIVKCFVLKNGVDSAKLVSGREVSENDGLDSMDCRAELNVDDREVFVTGSVGEAADREILLIVKETGEENKIAAITSVTPGKNGYFETLLKISDQTEADDFKLITALNNNGKKTDKEAEVKFERIFCMPDKDTLNNYISDLNAEDPDLFKKTVDLLADNKIILDDAVKAEYLQHKDEILKAAFDYVTAHKVSKICGFDNCLKAFCAETAMQYAEDTDTCFKEYAEVMGIDLGGEYSLIEHKVGNTYKALAAEADVKTPEAIEELFRKSIAIAYVNASGADKMDEILQKYNSFFKLDLAGDYAKLNKTDVCKLLVNKNFKSIEEIRAAFNNGIALVKKNTSQPSGGTGGGGGGSSKTVPITVSPNTADQTKEATENEAAYYSDVAKTRWSYSAISALSQMGIINGDNGQFKPENNVTREEFAKMIVLAAGCYNTAAKSDFDDIPQKAWYESYVASAFEAGIVNGTSDVTFGVGLDIRREDMAVMIYRAFKQAAGETAVIKDYAGFLDDDRISDYAKEAVRVLYSRNVISGFDDNTFLPGSPSTREQAAVMIYNMLSLIRK